MFVALDNLALAHAVETRASTYISYSPMAGPINSTFKKAVIQHDAANVITKGDFCWKLVDDIILP